MKKSKLMPMILVSSKKEFQIIKTIDPNVPKVEYKAVKGKYFTEDKDGNFVFLTQEEVQKMFKIHQTFTMTIASYR